MDVIHLTKDSYQKLISQKEKDVLIDFWAEWCGPCKMLAPELEALAAAHDDLIVGKVNVDEFAEIAVELGVDSIPALFFYQNGILKKRLVGYQDKASLEANLGL